MGSTSKSFKLLQAVVDSGAGGVAFSEVVRKTSLPKSTAHRLLNELVELGALRFDVDSKSYHGGLLLARLGGNVTASYDIRQTVRPYLEELQATTGHTCTLGIRNGKEGVYIDKIESDDFRIRLHSEVGKSFPLYCTGIGKALLAQLSAREFGECLPKRLSAYTRHTITTRSALKAELATVRRAGFAIDDGEITRGMLCIAAPVFGPDGNVAGALSCTFPSYVREERSIDLEIAAVKQAALAASGYPSNPS